jgi:hypothetical protein
MNILVPRWSMGKLGLRLSARVPISGGSSMDGDAGILGDTEKEEAESETSDGAPSAESAREVSDASDGDGRGASKLLLMGEIVLVRRQWS